MSSGSGIFSTVQTSLSQLCVVTSHGFHAGREPLAHACSQSKIVEKATVEKDSQPLYSGPFVSLKSEVHGQKQQVRILAWDEPVL